VTLPLKPGAVRPANDANPVPTELLKVFIEQNAVEALVPGGVFVGAAPDGAQQAGCVSLADAGSSKPEEENTRLLWKRVQVRAMGPTLWEAEAVGKHVFDLLRRQRWLVVEDSDGHGWFVHSIYITASPSQHLDSSETWEVLGFVNITIGADPVS
jgi:hypothetical protein